jgi:4-amino-4-deoxy-L-arabinose transferase-like glycosyltransferase
LLAGVLCLHFAVATVGWQRNLVTSHEFRQAQTALTIWALQEDGWSLDYPTPVLGAPWSVPLEFPLYQGLVAGLSKLGGWAIEPTGRAVALALFYLTLPAFWLWLTDWGLSRRHRLIALAFLLSGPLYVAYSRAVLIESTALGAGVWFLVGLQRFVATGRTGWWVLAAVAGALAATVKSTTFAVIAVPAVAWVLAVGTGRITVRPSGWSRAIGRAALAAALPVAAGLAWVVYTDAVKAQNAYADFLQSARLSQWSIGPLGDRFHGEFWGTILRTTMRSVAGPALLLLALAALPWALRRDRWLPALGVAAFLAGPLVFATLYAKHDYYFYATGAFLLLAAGAVVAHALDEWPLPAAARWSALGLALALQAVAYGREYWRYQGGEDSAPPRAAEALAVATQPGDVVILAGRDWNPALPWFAQRRALALPFHRELEQPTLDRALDALIRDGRPVTAALLTGRWRESAELVELLAERFGLGREPVLEFEGNALHVRVGEMVAARRRLAASGVGAQLGLREAGAGADGPSPRPPPEMPPTVTTTEPDPEIFGLFHPLPVAATVAYGFGAFEVAGERAVSVHAPSEVEFYLPDGATRLEATFLMSPGAYTEGGNSDGVEFELELVNPGAEPKLLFRRFLNPLQVPVDRGAHDIALEINARPGATLYARTLPGPRGESNYDWAFWRRIDIR